MKVLYFQQPRQQIGLHSRSQCSLGSNHATKRPPAQPQHQHHRPGPKLQSCDVAKTTSPLYLTRAGLGWAVVGPSDETLQAAVRQRWPDFLKAEPSTVVILTLALPLC